MNDREIKKIKKYPFLGYSSNLIESFLIIGFDTPFKIEKSNEIAEKMESISKKKDEYINSELQMHKISNKPVILNNISSDFSDGMLKEEEIINYMFPNGDIPIYACLSKETKEIKEVKEAKEIKERKDRRSEPLISSYIANSPILQKSLSPPNQNLIFYLSSDKIIEKCPKDEKEKKLNSHIMFNVYGYLFWENNIVKNCKIFFPKIFVFISQYSYFKFFSYLSQNIIYRIKNNINFEIPLEIQIYNIVNFTPCPISCDLQLDLLVNCDLLNIKPKKQAGIIKIEKEIRKDNKKEDENIQKKQNEINSMTLLQLSGYPYFDMDLSNLFGNFNFQSLYTIILFSFLEYKIIFFSPSLEFINTIMYIIRFLSYPFIDNNDLGQIYAISKEDFISGKKLDNNLIGVNCAYDEKMNIPIADKEYFIVNYNEDSLNIFYNKEKIFNHIINRNKIDSNNNNDLNNLNISNTFELKNNNCNVGKIINCINNAIEKEKQEEEEEEGKKEMKGLEGMIRLMHRSLFQCFRNIMNNDKIYYKNNNISSKNFIKELDFDKKNDNNAEKHFDYKNYDYQYDEYREYNESILKAFFNFNLKIYQKCHDKIKLIVTNEHSNQNECKYENIFYDLDIGGNDSNDLEECDKIFLDLFEKTSKYNQFINLFLKENLCCELNRPSMIMTEEFLNINKALKKNEVKDYFQIINSFYQNSRLIGKIDFNDFFTYYREKLAKKFFFITLNSTKVEQCIYESKASKKYIYKQKEFQLDNDILRKYTYILNNMEEKELYNLFPSLKFKLTENVLPEMNYTFFATNLEANLLKEKFYEVEKILIVIILAIYIIALKNKIILFHFFEEIMKHNDIKKTIILRKYIYLILSILNDMIKEKLNKNENCINELLLYKEIMNCIYKKEKDYYYPNEGLSTLIYNFNIFQKKYEEIQESHKYDNENKEIIAKYNSSQRDTLEEGVSYIVILKDNACKDKGPIKEEALISTVETLGYVGTIQYTCKSCQSRIKPDLFFVIVPLNKSGNAGFLSLNSSYKIIMNVLKNILTNNVKDKSKTEKDLFDVIGNIIYYINFKKGKKNIISDFLASCLK